MLGVEHCVIHVVLRMRSVVRHLHDVYAVHIRWTSMHGRSKLLIMVKMVRVRAGVRVRARARKCITYFFPSGLILQNVMKILACNKYLTSDITVSNRVNVV